jgi:glutamine amidotransferase
MCRWLAYSGGSLPLNELIYNTQHSLIDQSLDARISTQPTNGDGFGVGWYDHREFPGLYKETRPAWNDPNLEDLCLHVSSPMFLAHIRAATGTAIQRSNSHPFRYGRWLLVHNGLIEGYSYIKRDLAMTLSADLFMHLAGTTDSELMFLLALHFGLQEDAYTGVAKMAGLVERLGHEAGIEHPLQMTLGITDGQRIFAVRYSSQRDSRTLFHSRSKAAIAQMLPEARQERLQRFSDDAMAVVSEPLSDLPDMWEAVPESTFLTVERGEVQTRAFVPIP